MDYFDIWHIDRKPRKEKTKTAFFGGCGYVCPD